MKKFLFDNDNDYLPKGRIVWLVFDLDNGHPWSHRYTWWFDSYQAAYEHIKWQKKQNGANLSKPVKFIKG
jgi:hypothetical protein